MRRARIRRSTTSPTTADATGKSVILRRYADRPLTVRPKSIFLTATSARRYYGEENGTLAFRRGHRLQLGGGIIVVLQNLQQFLPGTRKSFPPILNSQLGGIIGKGPWSTGQQRTR